MAAPQKPLDVDINRYCVVLGCKNTGHELKFWKKTPCTEHGHKFHEKCGCRRPFVLYAFPKASKLRKLWLNRIGLPELEVTNSTCICSIHFVEGKPTTRSYFPTLYLQLDLSDEDEEQVDINLSSEEKSQDLEPKSEFPEVETAFQYEDIEIGSEPIDLFENSPMDMNSMKTATEEQGSKDSLENESSNSNEMRYCDAINSILPDTIEESGKQNNVINGQTSSNVDDDSDAEIEVLYQSAPTKPAPLAKYDPAAQTLQISNPVQYIVECHKRIAQLLGENERLKLAYETDVGQLKSQNKTLKRKLLRATSNSNGSLNRLSAMSPLARQRQKYRLIQKQGKGKNEMVLIRTRNNL